MEQIVNMHIYWCYLMEEILDVSICKYTIDIKKREIELTSQDVICEAIYQVC